MTDSHPLESKPPRSLPSTPSPTSLPKDQSARPPRPALAPVLLLALLIALPWLTPFSSGPSAAVWPQWFGMVCLGVALWLFLKASDVWFTGLGAALLVCVGLGAGAWVEALTVTTGVCLVILVGAARLGWSQGLGSGMGTSTSTGTHVGQLGSGGRWLRAIVWGWLAAALLSCAIGLLQYFKLEGPLAPFLASSWKGEAFANLRQKNQFASLANMAWFACAWLALCAPFGGVANTMGKHEAVATGRIHGSLWAMAAGILGLGNAMAASRTGLVQMLCMLGLALWWGWPSALQAVVSATAAVGSVGRSASRTCETAVAKGRMLWALAIANVGGFLLGSFALPLLVASGVGASIARREVPGAEGCHSRLLVWRNVWQLVTERPWTGWGWGHLDEAHYLGTFNDRFCEILDNAHNLPLHLAVELGLPVAALVCGSVVWFLLKTWPPRGVFGARHMAWGVLVTLMLHSLLEYPLWYAPFQTAAALALGLLWAGQWARPHEVLNNDKDTNNGDGAGACAGGGGASAPIDAQTAKKPSNWHFVQQSRHLFAIILGVILAGTAWDYWRVSQMYVQPEQRSEAYRVDTLEKIKSSWLFEGQVGFAELSVTAVTPANAATVLTLAQRQLVYSPEPRVIEKLLESAATLGRTDLVALHRARYAAAFPGEFKQWDAALASSRVPAPKPTRLPLP